MSSADLKARLHIEGRFDVFSSGSIAGVDRSGASSIALNGNVNVLAVATGGDLWSSLAAVGSGRLLAGNSAAAAKVGKITVTGKLTQKATAQNSGGDVGTVFASDSVLVAGGFHRFSSDFGNHVTRYRLASNDVISLKGGFDLEANAYGGNTLFNAVGTADIHLDGVDITVDGNGIERANATGHGIAVDSFSYYPDVRADLVLTVDGGSTTHVDSGVFGRIVHEGSSILFKSALDAEAYAEGSHLNSISASAFALLDAAKTKVLGGKTVSSSVVHH